MIHLHTITSAADWPAAVIPIASHLSERLPRWATHGPHPPTAPFATYLIPQLKVLATETYSENASELPSPALLGELFDLVMSSCADLRTLSSRPLYQPKLTRTITFGLIASLFRSFAKELIPRKSARFIRGGTMEFSLVQTLTNEDLAASEAKIWAFLHPEQGPTFLDSDIEKEKAIDNREASACSYGEHLSHEAKQEEILYHRGSSWFDEPDILEETERSENSSQPSLASLEVPESARVLVPLLRDYVDIPVVCVAEAKVMPSIMSKLLYQRDIWGLNEPVLGFIISDDGLVVRFVIGWTEIHERKNRAHMASSSVSSVEEGLGAYNLSNPLACMSFARFILGLEVTIHALSNTLFNQARDYISTSWNWSPDTTRSRLCRTSFIEQWRLQVADNLQLSVDCPPSSVSDPQKSAMTDRPPRISKFSARDAPPTTRSSSRRTAPDTTASSLSDSSPMTLAVPQHPQPSKSEPSDDALSQTSSVSRLPNYRRCAISDITDSPGGSVIECLIDRDVYIVPYIIADQSTVAGAVESYFRQIQNMVSTYDKDTSFHWAESWKQEADFPDFGSRFTKYWTDLLDYAKSIPLKAFLRKEEAKALSDRLPTILESCDLARIRDRLGLMMGADEAERRQAWDQFFTRTFLSMDIATIDILFERRMNLLVNPYYKRIIENVLLTVTDIQRHYDRLRIVQLIYSSAEQSLLTRPGSLQQQAQLETATAYIRYLMARVAKLLSEPPDLAASSFREIIRQRCAVESLLGICDTLLVVPCKGAGRQMHETLFNTLCQSAGPNANRAKIFEQSVAMLEDFQLFLSPAPDSPPEPPPVLALRNTKNVTPSPDLIPPKQKANENLKAPSAHSTVKLNNGFEGRVRATLNPFASGHSTADGIPRLAHSASSPEQTSSKEPSSGSTDSFDSFLAQYYMSPKALHFGPDFIIPLFLVEHERFGDIRVHGASNQARLYAASALEFLRRIGAPKQPVYIFVTNGNQGALSMAMHGGPGKDSKSVNSQNCCAFSQIDQYEQGLTLLMEWTVRVYDIGRPGDAYELSCFLQRLAHRAKELQIKFQQRLPAFLKEIRADPNILKWSMISYLPEQERNKYRNKIIEEMQPPVEQPEDNVQDSESSAS